LPNLGFFHDLLVSKSQRELKNCLGPKKRLNFKSLGICDFEPEIYLNPRDDGMCAQILAFGFREPLNCYFLSQFIKHEGFDVVLDVGSNIGYFPLVELASGATEVIAIEPVPETFWFLEKNLRTYANAIALNLAVSDKNGTVTLFVPNERNLASVMPDVDYLKFVKASIVDKVNAQACTLQRIIDDFNLGDSRILLRMDIEGYEKVIGYDLSHAIKAVSVELHTPILGYEESMRLFNHWLKSGFKPVFLSRELNGLNPLINRIGLLPSLRLYELVIRRRTYSKPDLNTIKYFVRLQRENPHLFLLRD
jgi:FkbM family methyltransferase